MSVDSFAKKILKQLKPKRCPACNGMGFKPSVSQNDIAKVINEYLVLLRQESDKKILYTVKHSRNSRIKGNHDK